MANFVGNDATRLWTEDSETDTDDSIPDSVLFNKRTPQKKWTVNDRAVGSCVGTFDAATVAADTTSIRQEEEDRKIAANGSDLASDEDIVKHIASNRTFMSCIFPLLERIGFDHRKNTGYVFGELVFDSENDVRKFLAIQGIPNADNLNADGLRWLTTWAKYVHVRRSDFQQISEPISNNDVRFILRNKLNQNITDLEDVAHRVRGNGVGAILDDRRARTKLDQKEVLKLRLWAARFNVDLPPYRDIAAKTLPVSDLHSAAPTSVPPLPSRPSLSPTKAPTDAPKRRGAAAKRAKKKKTKKNPANQSKESVSYGSGTPFVRVRIKKIHSIFCQLGCIKFSSSSGYRLVADDGSIIKQFSSHADDVRSYMLNNGVPNIERLNEMEREELHRDLVGLYVPPENYRDALGNHNGFASSDLKVPSNEEAARLLKDMGNIEGHSGAWHSPGREQHFESIEKLRAHVRASSMPFGHQRAGRSSFQQDLASKKKLLALRIWAASSETPLPVFQWDVNPQYNRVSVDSNVAPDGNAQSHGPRDTFPTEVVLTNQEPTSVVAKAGEKKTAFERLTELEACKEFFTDSEYKLKKQEIWKSI